MLEILLKNWKKLLTLNTHTMKVTKIFGEDVFGTTMIEFIIDGEVAYRDYESFCSEYGYKPISEFNTREAAQRVISAEATIAEGSFAQIGICDLMDRLGYDFTKHSYEEECEMVRQWCNMWNVMLYERPREEFSKSEGYHMAKNLGFNGVLYSDLS